MTKIVRTQPAKAGQQITVTDAQNRSLQAEAVGEIIDDKGVAFKVDGQWKVAGNSNQTQQSRNQLDRHTPKSKSVSLYPFIRLYLANSQGYKDGDGYDGVKTSQAFLFVLGGVHSRKGRTKFILVGVDNSGNYYLGNLNIMPTLNEIQSAILGSQNYYYLGSRFLKPKNSNNLIVYPTLTKSSNHLSDLRLDRFSAVSPSSTQKTTINNDSTVWFNYSKSLIINNTYNTTYTIQGIDSGIVECEPTYVFNPVPNFLTGFNQTTPYSRQREIVSSQNKELSVTYVYNTVSQLLSDNSSTITGSVSITESGSSNYSHNMDALINGYNDYASDTSINESFVYAADELPYTLNYTQTITESIDIQLPDQVVSLSNLTTVTVTENGNYGIVSQSQTIVKPFATSNANINNTRQYDGSDTLNTNYDCNEVYFDVILVFNIDNYILLKKERKGVLNITLTIDYSTIQASQTTYTSTSPISLGEIFNGDPYDYYTSWSFSKGDFTAIEHGFRFDNPFLNFTSSTSVTNLLTQGYVNYESLTADSKISEIKIGETVIDTVNDFCLISNNSYDLSIGENVISLSDSSFTFVGNQQSRTIYTSFANGNEDWFFNNTLPVLIYTRNNNFARAMITGITFQDYSFNGNIYKRKILTVTINVLEILTDYCAAEYLDGTVIFTPDKCFNFIRSMLEYKKSQENLIHIGLGLGKKININAVIKGIPTIYIAEQADESVKQKKNVKVDVYRLNGANFSRYPNQKGDIGKREKISNTNSEFWLYYD